MLLPYLFVVLRLPVILWWSRSRPIRRKHFKPACKIAFKVQIKISVNHYTVAPSPSIGPRATCEARHCFRMALLEFRGI
ncbi:hypothetical protein EVAR_51465_1 [Eumeta japonica]|uniref:Secreted protein n=1 Tax=Eumeta variegata TaxID=151549 RepID=A0A4C1Z5H8_EUMVA|nr:hypothetical protein EVAR_51465_1 [Eumeta japonica]